MILLRDIRKTYRMGRLNFEALKGIDLAIEDGELLALSGVSGSGKSTLLNIIGAMDRPTTGSVFVDDEDIGTYENRRLRAFRARQIGFIFQNFNLIPALNAYENIVVPLEMKGMAFEKRKVLELIERVGLEGHVRHRPDELSGGQKQRVAIARALVHGPRYILADEPTANLDGENARKIVALLTEINASLGVCVIFASHDPWVMESVKRVVRLVDGRMAEREGVA
jgi:putative ABC transport system ATP-binding protein